MFTTLAAVLCHSLIADAPQVCVEEVVTDSGMDSRLTWISCQIDGQQGIAEWLKTNPKYQGWRLAKWKCVAGHYSPPRAI